MPDDEVAKYLGPKQPRQPSLRESVDAELARIEEAPRSHATITADTEHVGGEVEVERKGWRVVGYARYYWDKTKGWVAGGRATKEW